MDDRVDVGVLGATGAVGQRFVQLLAAHPWFEVTEVVASDRSAGKPYREAARWKLASEIPVGVADRIVGSLGKPLESKLLFSGLENQGLDESAVNGDFAVVPAKDDALATALDDRPLDNVAVLHEDATGPQIGRDKTRQDGRQCQHKARPVSPRSCRASRFIRLTHL